MFILPRQARDKHREMLTERAFSVCSYRRLKCSGSTLVRERGGFCANFYANNRTFAKTGSGQT
jgi:hypothetical protein